MTDGNVIAFPSPPRRWASDSPASGCTVTIDARVSFVDVDRDALAAQLRDLAETVEGPLGRAFFGGEA